MPRTDTKLERRVEIVKLLQGKKMRTGELAEYFEVDERTIRKDIDVLREGLDVFGTTIKIESKHQGSPEHYHTSTVHPVMLALNLTELFALLRQLEDAAAEHPDGGVFQHLFDCVYSQITQYAEDRLKDKLRKEHAVCVSKNRLEEKAVFRGAVYWAKSGRQVEISFRDGESLRTANARLLDIDRSYRLKIKLEDGEERLLDYNDVIIDWPKLEYE